MRVLAFDDFVCVYEMIFIGILGEIAFGEGEGVVSRDVRDGVGFFFLRNWFFGS